MAARRNNGLKSGRRGHLLALEPRMMFDAAVAATNEAVLGHVRMNEPGSHGFVPPLDMPAGDDAAHRVLAADTARAASGGSRTLRPQAQEAPTPAPAASHEVIFIDTGVENYQQLAAEWASRGEVVLIDDRSDGLAQVEAALANESDVSAIHIVSHGEEGAFFLGTTRVDQASITGSLAGELAQIGKSLEPGGDILIYGCDFAEGSDGAAALQAFATATGADVAASTDLTGAADRGGDWTLEAHDGAIQAHSLSSSDYQYVLGPNTPVPIAVTANSLTVTDANGNVVVSHSADYSSSTGYGSDNRSPDLTQAGAVAVWDNVATYQGQALDLKATVVSLSAGDAVRFNAPGGTSQEADDATFLLRDLTNNGTDATISVKWELVLHGTNTDAPADVEFTIGDIDGIGGQPNANSTAPTRESVSTSTDNLAYYTSETGSDIYFTSSLSQITAAGTQDENTDRNAPENTKSNATFDYTDVSSFILNYKLASNTVATQAQFYQDGNATLKYTDPVYVSIPHLDLDADDSTAPGNDAHFTYTEDAGAVPIVDGDVKVTNPMDTDSIVGATVVLTNAKSGDVLTVGTLPSNITDTITSSNGQITIAFTGNGSEADYQDALKAVTFSNTLAAKPDTTQRIIDIDFSNGTLTSATAVSRIDVVDVNHAPTDVGTLADQSAQDAQAVSYATAGGFTDVDGDTLAYSASGLPTGLTIDSASGMISGTIDRSASQVNGGAYAVVVTATDPSNASATQSFHIGVTNPPPTANNDTANTAEDIPVKIAVLANDTDPDGDPLTVTSASAQHGSVAINPDGTVTYTPDANYNGSDTIDYAISDGQGGTSAATVALTIQPQPDPPAALVPGAQTGAEDSALVFSAANGNAITVADPDGGQQTVTLTASHGTLTLGSTTGLTFATGDGTGDATMTFTGSIAAINSALDGTAFAPAADYNGAAQIAVDVATVPVTGEDFTNGDLEQPHIAAGTQTDVDDATVPGWRTTESDHQIEIWGTGYRGVDAYQGNQFFEVNANEAATLYQDFRSIAGSPVSVDFAHRGRAGTDVMQVTAVDLGPDGVYGTADDVVLSSQQYSDGNTAWGAYTQQITSSASGDLIRLEFTAVSSATGDNSVGNFLDAVAVHQNSVATTDSKTIAVTVTPVADIVDDSATTPENTAVTTSPLANDSFSDPTRTIVAIDGTAITAGGAAVSVADGTVQLDNADHLIFTPASDYHGTTSYTYTVAAGGTTETGTDTITVAHVNQPPSDVGTLPQRSTVDSATVSWATAGSFTDVDGDTLSYSATGLPAGLAIDSATGVISGTLGHSDSQANGGHYAIVVTATDPSGASAAQNFVVDVANPAPHAGNDRATTHVDTPADINVLANDSDPDGDPIAVTAATAANGTVSINPDGTLHYTPDAGFAGTDTIAYTITDGDGATGQAIVTVTISDAAPIASPIGNQAAQDGQSVMLPVGNGFSDPDGDTLSYSATGLPAGLAIDMATGIVSGMIDRSASQTAGGIYNSVVTANDGHGGTTSAAFRWTVTDPAPTAHDDSATTPENTTIAIAPLANDTDPDGDPLSIDTASAPHGTVAIDPDGTITYTPNAGFVGIDTIAYTITDGEGGRSAAHVAVTVTPVDNGPGATTLAPRSDHDDGTVSVPTAQAFSDAAGNPLTYSATGLPAGVSIDPATGIISGTLGSADDTGGPNADGRYPVTVIATDPSGRQAASGFTWSVTPTGPIAQDDSATTPQETPVTIDVLSNDSDPNGASFTVTDATAYHGSVAINPDGTLGFTPDAGFRGDATISYTITDTGGAMASATVTVAVTPVAHAPVAMPIPATYGQDAQSGIAIPAASYFSDADGDALTYSATSLPPGLSLDPSTGLISGTIDHSASQVNGGVYHVVVTATDPSGAHADNAFDWTITNPAPTAHDDSASTTRNLPATIDVLANDVDPDGDALMVTSARAGHGTVAINPDGTLTYTPNAGYIGSDIISYAISDGQGGRSTAAVAMTVLDDAPVAHPDTAGTRIDTPVTIPVLANDTDADGDPLTVTGAGAQHGTVAINPDGTITYTPDAGYSGADTIAYTVGDGHGGTAGSTVAVTIDPDHAPVANPDTASTRAGAPVTIPVLANDTDADGDPLTVTGASAQHGTVTINPDGTITYTPDAGYSGADTIAYTVGDGHGGTAGSTVALAVMPDNAPTIDPRAPVGTIAGRPLTIDGLAGAHDADGDPLTITSATVAAGTVAINPDGTLTYTPARGFVGTTSITYTIDDGHGGTATATIVVRVAAPQGPADTQQALAIGRGLSPAWESPPGASGDPGDAGIGLGGIGLGGIGLGGIGFDPMRPIELGDGVIHSPFPTLSAVNAIRSLDGTTDLSGSTPITDTVAGLGSLGSIGEGGGENAGAGDIGLGGVPEGQGRTYPVGAEVARLGRLADFRDAAARLFDHRWGDLGDFGAHPFAGFSTAADRNDGVEIETLVQGGAIYVDVRDTAPDAKAAISRVDVTLADGGRPEWIAVDPRGFAIVEAGAATDEIHLVVSVTRTDGSRSATPVVVQAATGEIEIDRHAHAATPAHATAHHHPGRAAPLDATLHTPHAATHAAAHKLSKTFQ